MSDPIIEIANDTDATSLLDPPTEGSSRKSILFFWAEWHPPSNSGGIFDTVVCPLISTLAFPLAFFFRLLRWLLFSFRFSFCHFFQTHSCLPMMPLVEILLCVAFRSRSKRWLSKTTTTFNFIESVQRRLQSLVIRYALFGVQRNAVWHSLVLTMKCQCRGHSCSSPHK